MVDLSELTDFNFQGENFKKNQIILVETKRNFKDYIKSLKYRYNKKNPYLPNYLINKEGEIFLIMKPEKFSKFMMSEDIDSNSIIISLENFGWLKKNTLDNSHVNWIGDIYKGEVYEKKWRDKFFWDKYQEKQVEKLCELIVSLCDKFNIPKKTIGHNVRFEGIENYKGIVSKSNFDFSNKDVNPSFDFKLIEKKIQT
jgi:N-acetyl-anhydromuramyl-L-alanine amidase AmpD